MSSFITFPPLYFFLCSCQKLWIYSLPEPFLPSVNSFASIDSDILLKEIIHLGSLQIQSDIILIRSERENWQNTLGVVSIGDDKQ